MDRLGRADERWSAAKGAAQLLNLRRYERLKFELAETLRSVAAHATKGETGTSAQLQELFARLAEDRFNLVVVGRFSRGKTSLMNALLETERLPVGILPLTSVITTIRFGSPERAIIWYRDSHRSPFDIPIAELTEYVTQAHNPGNIKGIRTAEIHLNAELLRRGFCFIDTPGLGSAVLENTRTTEDYLPEADAILLVTSFDSPLSQEEVRTIQTAHFAGKRVFVAVNKQDLVAEPERGEALRYVSDALDREFGDGHCSIASVSAREALETLQHDDPLRMARSGVPELRETLTQFMVSEKREEFIRRLCDRIEDIGVACLDKPRAATLRETLYAFGRQLDSPLRVPCHNAVVESAEIPSLATELPPPCEICEFVSKVCFEFLSKYQYALLVEPDVRQRHAERGGFCRLHTWQYWGLASPRGACIASPPLLEAIAQRMREHSIQDGEATSCILCKICARAEHQIIERIARSIRRDPNGLRALTAICLPHHRLLVAALADPDLQKLAMLREAALLNRLAEDMRRYATKFDAIRRNLASDEERRAGQVAIAVLSGQRNLVMSTADGVLV